MLSIATKHYPKLLSDLGCTVYSVQNLINAEYSENNLLSVQLLVNDSSRKNICICMHTHFLGREV